YHSWVIASKDLPNELKVTATDENGLIMAIEHTEYDVCGVQFHPESVLTPSGETVIKNWLLK
ncbi:MAG: gamma-glutamyl-gamma-aminobutyrate hydrolase family protein, partial [Sediminibacterium sp.]